MYSLLVGLSFRRESITKWSDGKVDECCEFFLVRLLQLIHKSLSSSLTLLSVYGGAGASGRVGRSSGHCIISALFRSVSVLTSLGPFWYASSFTWPRGLEGFSSDSDITHCINL